MKSFLLLCLTSCLVLKWILSQASNEDSRFGRMLRRSRPKRYATRIDWTDVWKDMNDRVRREQREEVRMSAIQDLLRRLSVEAELLNQENWGELSGMFSEMLSGIDGDSHGR